MPSWLGPDFESFNQNVIFRLIASAVLLLLMAKMFAAVRQRRATDSSIFDLLVKRTSHCCVIECLLGFSASQQTVIKPLVAA